MQSFSAIIQPYQSRYLEFQFNTITLADTVKHPILNSPRPIEFLMVVNRAGNAISVSLWNESIDLSAAGTLIGIPLQPGDSYIQSVDNTTYDFAQALSVMFDKPNPLPRNAINSALWFVRASAANSIVVDVCVGLGPNQ